MDYCLKVADEIPELMDIGIKYIKYDDDKIIMGFNHPELGLCHFDVGLHFNYCPICGKKLEGIR